MRFLSVRGKRENPTGSGGRGSRFFCGEERGMGPNPYRKDFQRIILGRYFLCDFFKILTVRICKSTPPSVHQTDGRMPILSDGYILMNKDVYGRT